MVQMRTLMVVVLGAIVVGLPVFSPMLRAKKGPATPTEATVPQLERDIPELMKKAGVPGLAIAVIRGGKTTWLHGFGMKEVKTGQPLTGETVFEAASLSKPVFTYGVLKLVEQGKLGLDVPLTTYLPKPFVAGDERLAKITARIVLSHRTGFPNWPADDGSVSIYFTPGERFSYSGQGYIYLQRVVEQYHTELSDENHPKCRHTVWHNRSGTGRTPNREPANWRTGLHSSRTQRKAVQVCCSRWS
jgi:CubicO group peptidase (beta-lactamase class C family)